MLAWGLPSGVSGACDNTLIPEWRCPVKRPSQDPGEHRANGINVHTSICDLHPWQMLWTWAKRRHPDKSRKWVKARYFRDDGYWTFWEGKAELVKPDATPITRFTKVTGRNSPYDPALRQYWTERKKQQVGRETYAKQRLMLLQRQEYRCALCHIQFIPGEAIETDHINLKSQGGTDDLNNKRLVHPWCHRQRHQQDGQQRPRA